MGQRAYVSRGGQKLQAALEGFAIDVTGWICADFGVNVGGFTDCLLRRGAAKVYALDTGYGQLAWGLRRDSRVVVMERTNALYAPLPPDCPGGVDLVVIDVAFTPQRLIVPAAGKWLARGGRIVCLFKPHYELEKLEGQAHRPQSLDFPQAAATFDSICGDLARQGFTALAGMVSPLKGKGGNFEFLALLERA